MRMGLLTLALLVQAGLQAPFRVRGDEPPSGDVPPQVFVDKGACPFECCTYRDWTVDADTQLYDRPGGKKLPAILKKGEHVTGVTGEVHVVPQRVKVVRDHDPFRRGETFYLLTYLGEGAFRIWYKGRVSRESPDFAWLGPDSCSHSKEGCWGERVGKYESKWWVKVRSASGVEGWSDQPEHFGDKDACA